MITPITTANRVNSTHGWLSQPLNGTALILPVQLGAHQLAHYRRRAGAVCFGFIRGAAESVFSRGSRGRRRVKTFHLVLDGFESTRQHARVGRPFVRLFGHQVADDGVEVGRQVRHESNRRIELTKAMLMKQIEHFALERRMTDQQRVENDAEGIKIAAPRHRLAGRLFRRQELGRADHSSGDGQVSAGEQASDAEVGELDRKRGEGRETRGEGGEASLLAPRPSPLAPS